MQNGSPYPLRSDVSQRQLSITNDSNVPPGFRGSRKWGVAFLAKSQKVGMKISVVGGYVA